MYSKMCSKWHISLSFTPTKLSKTNIFVQKVNLINSVYFEPERDELIVKLYFLVLKIYEKIICISRPLPMLSFYNIVSIIKLWQFYVNICISISNSIYYFPSIFKKNVRRLAKEGLNIKNQLAIQSNYFFFNSYTVNEPNHKHHNVKDKKPILLSVYVIAILYNKMILL